MKKIIGMLCLCALAGVCAQAQRISPVAGTQPADYSWHCKQQFPSGQPAQKTVVPNELDVRSCDVSGWDFTSYTADELADVLTFDSRTQFPPANKLPKGFPPKNILKQNQNPGLGVRALHKKGITGKGVSVAIIDQSLLLNHEQYADRIQYYWQDSIYQDSNASMHGAAVASILAGQTVGVAPQANIYYWAGKFEVEERVFNAGPIVDTLQRILNMSERFPAEQKIRVVSISRGFDESDKGTDKFEEVLSYLKAHNIAVFTTNDVMTISRNHSLSLADGTNYCRPAYWFDKENLNFYNQMPDPLVPTDFRVTAAPNGVRDYVHYAHGGLSWAVPYLAGLYALGVQVYPGLTKDIFMQAVRETADSYPCNWQGETFTVRYRVNPTSLMERLRQLNKN
ncbi:MAG: S8/S53 family peptidase [Elusimicrobiaceae bacterium]|nr:S8/S53 family peptidase [Elusimicrobiaceae bacterium]